MARTASTSGETHLVYGVRPVREVLEHRPDQIHHLSVARERRDQTAHELVQEAKLRGIPVHVEPKEALTRKAGTSQHQGIVAVISPVAYGRLEELVENPVARALLVDGVEDPRNLGALLRTAEAAGVGAVLLPHRRTVGVTPTVVKASAGAAFHLRFVRTGNVAETLSKLAEAGYETIGLDLGGTENPPESTGGRPWVLVVGSEGSGLRRLVRERCSYLLRLPMCGKVRSLNVSVAAGIAMYRLAFPALWSRREEA
ncbi:MAG: 23S rRNA (guanosine(2251)-2'-O)-methyltransferase RlmB [Acidobacteriota bacterium]